MRNHRSKEAGFLSLVRAELQGIVLVLFFLGAILFGNWPIRIAALTVFSSICAWVYWLARRGRFEVGVRVHIRSGPHQGLSGTVVAHLHGGRGARVAVLFGDRTETIEIHGGYELERDTAPRTQTRHETAAPKSSKA